METLTKKLTESFREIGYSEYKQIKTTKIPFSHDVFAQCERNTCGKFGKNHACPSPESSEDERRNMILDYRDAFIISITVPFRTKTDMENYEIILKEKHSKLRKQFADSDVKVLGVGPCTLCSECTAPENKPCRFPDQTQYSMEGCGSDVVSLSKQQQMTYNAGVGKMVFFALVLYKES